MGDLNHTNCCKWHGPPQLSASITPFANQAVGDTPPQQAPPGMTSRSIQAYLSDTLPASCSNHLLHLFLLRRLNISAFRSLTPVSKIQALLKMACPARSDQLFGPRVNALCRSLDFTLLFEDSIFGCLPAACLLLCAVPSLLNQARRFKGTSHRSKSILIAKLVSSFGCPTLPPSLAMLTLFLIDYLGGNSCRPNNILGV